MSYELTTTKKSLFSEMDTLFTHLCENQDTLKKALELYLGREVISIDVDNDEIIFNDDTGALRDRRFVGLCLCVDDIQDYLKPGNPSAIVKYMDENSDFPDGVCAWQPFEDYDAETLISQIYNAI